jgi:hypothetical protein
MDGSSLPSCGFMDFKMENHHTLSLKATVMSLCSNDHGDALRPVFFPMFSPLQLLGTAYFLSETGELLMMVSAVKYLERPCAAQEEIKLEILD